MRKLKGFVLAAMVSGLVFSAGASADDAAAPAAPAPAAAAPAAGASVALPDLNADDYFEGSEGGTFGRKVAKLLPNSKRVAVAGFRVMFVTQDNVSAQVRGSYMPGMDMTGAHASMTVDLQGVDAATMQALTDKAYQTFLAQLTAAGREIVPLDQIQPLFAQLNLAKMPYQKDYNGHSAQGYSPTGMPLWFTHVDGGWTDQGIVSQGNYNKFAAFSKDLNAFIIAPLIIVDFASMESSGNHSAFINKTAEVGAHLEMRINGIATPIVRATELKFGNVSGGDAAFIRTTKQFTVPTEFGTMEKVEERKTTGFMAVLTGSSKSKSTSNANTDNARYSAAATEVMTLGTGALAKFFQQHSPQ